MDCKLEMDWTNQIQLMMHFVDLIFQFCYLKKFCFSNNLWSTFLREFCGRAIFCMEISMILFFSYRLHALHVFYSWPDSNDYTWSNYSLSHWYLLSEKTLRFLVLNRIISYVRWKAGDLKNSLSRPKLWYFKRQTELSTLSVGVSW